MANSPQEILERLLREKDVIEKARLIKYLYNEQFYSLKEIAEHLHKHPSYVSHLLRLIKLPELVLDGYYSKTITLAHLVILSRLESDEKVVEAYKRILGENLTSAQSELLIRELKFDVKTTGGMLTKEQTEELKEKFKKKYPGTEIEIIQSRVKGKIKIEVKGDAVKTTEVIQTVIGALVPVEEHEEELQVLE